MTRLPAVAGMFYPKDAEELKHTVHALIEQAEEFPLQGKLRAIIVPHAGYPYSGAVAAQAYKLLRKQAFKKIILLGPSHYASFIGASIADEDFQTPLGVVKCADPSLLLKEGLIDLLPEAQRAEHSVEVQLPFLQDILSKFEIYSIVLGSTNEEKLAKHLSQFIDEDTLIIVSSDLSHYLSYDAALMKDNHTIGKILEGNSTALDACGKAPIKVLMHLAEIKRWTPSLIDYRNSGDTAGDKDRVVGYAAIAYTE